MEKVLRRKEMKDNTITEYKEMVTEGTIDFIGTSICISIWNTLITYMVVSDFRAVKQSILPLTLLVVIDLFYRFRNSNLVVINQKHLDKQLDMKERIQKVVAILQTIVAIFTIITL